MKEIKAEEVKEVEVTTEENTETEVAIEEVKESKLKVFGSKVKSGLQKHGKNIAKGAVIGLGLVAAYAIGSRTGGNDDEADVAADSADYVEIDEAETTDETSEPKTYTF